MTGTDLQAERTRVMLESFGTACHHLGGPATVVHGVLQSLQELTANSDDAIKDLVQSGLDAATQIGDILHRLNTVNEYRTRHVPGSSGTKVIEV